MTRVFVPLVILAGAVALSADSVQQAPAAQAPATAQNRPAQPPLAANEWRVDTAHSAAHFAVRHLMVSTVRGQLGAVTGSLQYDGKDVRSIAADVTIDVKAINTQNERRDNHLRSDDFFNAEKFPHITFKSKRVEPGANGTFKLVGDLTIRDHTREVALTVEGPSPIMTTQRGVATGATATAKISRKEFGVLWNNMVEAGPVVGDEVTITIDIQATRPSPPGQATTE